MKRLRIYHFAALFFSAAVAHAQVNLSTIPYTQNFDSLGTSSLPWANNSTLAGWYAANNNAGTVTPYSAYTATGGGGTSASTLYSMGDTTTPTDRALGGAPATTQTTLLGLQLANNTGSIFNDIQISYDFEQWSTRGTATITMSYQVFTAGTGSLSTLTGWNTLTTTASPLAITSPAQSGMGNTTGLISGVTGDITGLNLQPNDELWVRWSITKGTGANSTHGIDNVSVMTPVPEPSTSAFLGLGFLTLLGVARLRRVH
jgi:serralysin